MLRSINQVLGRAFPDWTAARAQDLFLRPRRSAKRDWEAEVETRAHRLKLRTGLSALHWTAPGMEQAETILCIHGWEGRATQFDPLAQQLMKSGLNVLAVDGPAHGSSPGREANPVEFARALLLVDHESGPFRAVVGHSMGAGAAALALSWGFRAQSAVLLASPSSISGVLSRYASFVGLPPAAEVRFFERMARHTGFHSHELDVAHVVQDLKIPGLVIHDRADQEVPFGDGEAIASNWQQARLHPVEGLGHRRLLRDPEVIDRVRRFLDDH
jgi:pimeloyl-ACP methyl ester carboxylesterase